MHFKLGFHGMKCAGGAVQTEQAERAEAGQAELQKALSDVATQQGLPSFHPLLELSKTQHDLQQAQRSNQAFERCVITFLPLSIQTHHCCALLWCIWAPCGEAAAAYEALLINKKGC